MYTWLYDSLAEGADVITASRRLSRELRSAYDLGQAARGLRAWRTPRIYTLTAWLDDLLLGCDPAVKLPMRLDVRNSALLWERLLRSFAHEQMLNPASLVRQVQQNWQRLQDWCVPVEELARYASNEDERLFAKVARAYQKELEEQGWTDPALLPALVAKHICAGTIRPGKRVAWAGFDRPAPCVNLLMRSIEQAGGTVRQIPLSRPPGNVSVISCTDPEAELRSAGFWARRQLEANPGERIAIVRPGLEQDAPRAARLVREGLAPGWQQGGRHYKTAVNVSYGRRLAEYPLIAIALLWLEWASKGLSSREVSVLLRSPFTGGGHIGDNCRLDLALRRLPDRVWSPAALSSALEAASEASAEPGWLQNVREVAAFASRFESPEPPATWARRIDDLLRKVGWPGKGLDSAEFQLVNRWRTSLNELSRLDIMRPQITAPEAIARLTAFATEAVYQPDDGPGSVQLLGILEAAGLEFDQLWVTGLDAQSWPPAAHPLPLVSRELQRKRYMPDATPADSLGFSRQVLQRLTCSAGEVVLSWPESHQGLELEPSPLLKPWFARGAQQVEDPGCYAGQWSGGDALGPACADPPPGIGFDERLLGGATTVQRQVEDPFSAFACGRLGATELPLFEVGLSASSRGIIIHRALHFLLTDCPSSADIAAWENCEERIRRSVDRALAKPRRTADDVLLRLLDIERSRLKTLLNAFVEQELVRQDFRIIALEKPVVLERHGVKLVLQIDRLDQNADGRFLVIDYKTGAPKNLLDQAGEPKQLQLVVYASAMEEAVGGLLLINIDSRSIVYRGAGDEWDRDRDEPWQERLSRWKTLVDNALLDIAKGDVRINQTRALLESRPLSLVSRIEELRRER